MDLGPDPPLSQVLRRLSPQALTGTAQLSAVAERLSRSSFRASDVVTRPHPLLVMVRRGELICLIALAEIWDKARDLLAPYSERLAGHEARLLLLGVPKHPDLALALNHGVAALLSPDPSAEELCVALHSAFELMDLK